MPWASIAAAAPPHLLVAAVEGGEVAEVGGALQGRRARLDLLRLDPGRLQLVEQPLQGARRSGAGRRSAAAAPAARAARAIATATARSRWAAESSAPGGAPAAVATVRKRAAEGHRRAAQQGAGTAAELALEGEDVVDGRHDQDRVALERRRRSSRRTTPARPELGGPWISFSGTRPSLGTAPASSGGRPPRPRKLGD